MKDISEITIAELKEAIRAFLSAECEKKTKDSSDIEKTKKYRPDIWLQEAQKKAARLKMGTHISKGIHSSSQGDNVYFSQKVDHDYVNTKTVTNNYLDGGGAASDFPLASFFEWEVIADSGIKMRDVILENGAAVQRCFADDPELSQTYQQTFLTCLQAQPQNPQTDALNKQLLWALPQTDDNRDNYLVLVPLHPSVLTHEFYHKIEAINNNRFDVKSKSVPQKRYADLLDLAQIKLGGSKPQNISVLTSKQRGINYLLPSLPPVFRARQDIHFSPKLESIFFSKSLYYRVEDDLKILFGVIYCKENNYEIRNMRKAAVHRIAHQILSIGETICALRPAGWSKDYDLSSAQKYWLDPKRADLAGEEKFKAERDAADWDKAIEKDFANWLQKVLEERFKKHRHEFTDIEHYEWQREMKAAIKESFRLNKRGLL